MDPGKMRHRITIQRFDGALDSYGDPQWRDDANWEDVATVWAAIDPVIGREFYAVEQSQSEVTHNIRCRYRPGVETAMRICFGARRFAIVSCIDWEERHESLLIKCKELVR